MVSMIYFYYLHVTHHDSQKEPKSICVPYIHYSHKDESLIVITNGTSIITIFRYILQFVNLRFNHFIFVQISVPIFIYMFPKGHIFFILSFYLCVIPSFE